MKGRLGPVAAALALLLLPALHADAAAGVRAGREPAGDPPRRPKIGLVLSGGGARGSAHVGVLKVMEELRIPVDYVVGTSRTADGSRFAARRTTSRR